MTKRIITITNNAWKKMISVTKKQKGEGFLFLAESGGCNGFNYKLNLIHEIELDDLLSKNKKFLPTIYEKENIRLIIDPLSEMFLVGTKIDYISENYAENIFENKFTFTANKNVVSSCGCGTSFNPKVDN